MGLPTNCCVESFKNTFDLCFLSASELTHAWGKNESLFQEMKHFMCLQKNVVFLCDDWQRLCLTASEPFRFETDVFCSFASSEPLQYNCF